MIGALVALLALPPQLLFAAVQITSSPRGTAVEPLALPALSASAIPGLPDATVLSLPPAEALDAAPLGGAQGATSVSAGAASRGNAAGPEIATPAAAPPRAAAGVDPRGAGFETRSWAEAEELGFARGAAPEDAQAGAPSADPRARLAPAPSRPEGEPRPPEPPKPRSILSRAVLGFFSSFAIIQVTVESLGLTVPQMTVTHGFLTLGLVSAASCIAYSLGSLAGGRWVARWGIRKVYPAVLFSRALIWGAAAALFDPTLQSVPVGELAALFSLDYFMHSIGRVAEHTLQVSWFGSSPVASSRFGAVRDFFEYGTVFGLLGTGLVIAAFGFGAVVYASPILFAAAGLIALALRALPGPNAVAAHSGLIAAFKALLAAPGLRMLFLGQVLLSNFFYVLYDITATVFSAFTGHGDPARAALIASALTGTYGLGALMGGFAMMGLWRRIEKRTEGLAPADQAAAQSRLLSLSASKALLWAAASLMGSWLFLSLSPLGTLIWPVFAVTPALAVIGLTTQIALNHLDTIFKARLPAESAAAILGATRTLIYLSYAVSFVVWGAVFQALLTRGFIALAVYCTIAAAAYVMLALRLRR